MARVSLLVTDITKKHKTKTQKVHHGATRNRNIGSPYVNHTDHTQINLVGREFTRGRLRKELRCFD